VIHLALVKFRSKFYDGPDAVIWVGYEGTGNPNDDHKQIGVSCQYKADKYGMVKAQCSAYTWGEDVMRFPVLEM
jgi:hypothetical protein